MIPVTGRTDEVALRLPEKRLFLLQTLKVSAHDCRYYNRTQYQTRMSQIWKGILLTKKVVDLVSYRYEKSLRQNGFLLKKDENQNVVLMMKLGHTAAVRG